jgi:hypothetical protein
MPRVPVAWGEWRPDAATLDTQFANDVENVFPASDSYLPVPSLVPFANTIVPPPPSTERVVGLFSARTTNGEWLIYAGTQSKLFSWTLFSGWTEVGSGYNVPAGELWSFAQFGKWVVAVQIGDDPVRADADAGGTFATFGAPRAHNVRVIGDFLVLGGLASNRRSIHWSAINDISGWTPGLNLSDVQEMPDGGPVMGLAGDTVGYILQDRAVRLMQFLPGDTTLIFTISRVVYERGSISEFGYVSVGDTLYMKCEDGFYAVAGAQLIPIGHEKVNDWFQANSDIGRSNIVQAVLAVKPYVFWAYHSSAGTPEGYYDRVILFNWVSQRWSKIAANAQMWGGAVASVNVDLDTDIAEPGDPLLDSNARGLDSFAYEGGRPRVAAIDQDGYLVELTGPNMQATLESGEAHLVPGSRALAGDVYPIADGVDGVIYDGYRERLQDAVQWTQAYPIEITGSAAVYNSARLHRFRHIIPRGSLWTHAQGVVVDAQRDGSVA